MVYHAEICGANVDDDASLRMMLRSSDVEKHKELFRRFLIAVCCGQKAGTRSRKRYDSLTRRAYQVALTIYGGMKSVIGRS